MQGVRTQDSVGRATGCLGKKCRGGFHLAFVDDALVAAGDDAALAVAGGPGLGWLVVGDGFGQRSLQRPDCRAAVGGGMKEEGIMSKRKLHYKLKARQKEC